jgi:hypothetical protein
MNALGEDFAASVATSESGIALIYKALDALVEQFDLDDAAVVLEEPSLGRRSSARAGARSAPTTKNCSSPRPVSTPAPRSTITPSTARSC